MDKTTQLLAEYMVYTALLGTAAYVVMLTILSHMALHP